MSRSGRRSQRGAPASNERELQAAGYTLIAGVDEAGRGPIAGPVTAAAVIMPLKPRVVGVNDSKTIDTPERLELEAQIKGAAIAWAVASSAARDIDDNDILRATWTAMEKALADLDPPADCLLVDGRSAPNFGVPCRPIVDGDRKCYSIAAASILAKVHRDRLMEEFDREYPGYGFARNKGYGTREHRRALLQMGPCAIHRRTFEPVRSLHQQRFEFEED